PVRGKRSGSAGRGAGLLPGLTAIWPAWPAPAAATNNRARRHRPRGRSRLSPGSGWLSCERLFGEPGQHLRGQQIIERAAAAEAKGANRHPAEAGFLEVDRETGMARGEQRDQAAQKRFVTDQQDAPSSQAAVV